MTLEKAYLLAEKLGLPSRKVIVVVHFEGFGWSDQNPRFGISVATTLSDQYPERLEKILLIDSPRLYEPLFNTVSLSLFLSQGVGSPIKPRCRSNLFWLLFKPPRFNL